jgi:serine/threonine protein phosphatase PrpC
MIYSIEPHWKTISQSIQGTSHERLGMVCQDTSGVSILQEVTLIATVADGAGSARFAETGSRLAVESTLKTLSNPEIIKNIFSEGASWRQILSNVVNSTRCVIEKHAQFLDTTISELATTLIVVVANKNRVFVAQIGDGGVVIADQSGGFNILSRPIKGEYANETYFLSSQDAVNLLQFAEYASTNFIAIFSDGLERLALQSPDDDPYHPFFRPLQDFIEKMDDVESATEELVTFLTSKKIRDRTDDDISLILCSLSH